MLMIGLMLGWYVAEKGWHRHLFYLVVVFALIGAMWR